MHEATGIAAAVGEAVQAIAPGAVIHAGDGLRGYGDVAIVRHDRRRTPLDAHNRALKVQQGDQVAQRPVVALLGNTGHATGPHVHREIRDGDTPASPRSLVPRSKPGSLIDPGGGPADDAEAAAAGR